MKKFYIYTFVIFAFFVIGIVVANFLIMPSIVRMGKETLVPNVCNIPLDEALEILKQKELEGIVVERRHDNIITDGRIIVQEPLPGARVKAGRIINLTVSLGAQTIRVPFLAGIGMETGRSILQRLGLNVKSIEYIFSDSIARTIIIETKPPPESELTKGDAVMLVVSKGSVMKMPNLVGVHIREAEDILKRMGLVLAEVREVEGSGTKGHILVQNPDAGQDVAYGDSVSLMVLR
jgi:serine/threonine-protein kinase